VCVEGLQGIVPARGVKTRSQACADELLKKSQKPPFDSMLKRAS
jgi:hypothetical protein